jgi:hypothetical protein
MFVAEANAPLECRVAQTAVVAFLPVQTMGQTFLPLPGKVVTPTISPPLLPNLFLSTVLLV